MANKMDTSRVREQRRTKDAKAELLRQLSARFGIVKNACKATGIPRSLYYKWLKEDAGFRAEVDNIMEEAKDFVEAKLYDNINNNDTQSILFYLKTKCKDRGYTERTEIQADITSGGKAFTGFSSVLPHYPNIEEVVAEKEQNRPTEE